MNHYKIHKPEAIDLILKYDLNFIEGNIIKYILRSPFKGDRIGDLKKALYYAKKLPNKLVYEGKRAEFVIDELDQYLHSKALYAIEVYAVMHVIHGNLDHTIEELIELIKLAIESRSHNENMQESTSKPIKALSNFEEKTTDWGWQQTWFTDDFNRPCYLAEYTGFDPDYVSDQLQSQRLLLGLKNKECPMILTRDLAEKVIYYLSNWLGGRLHEKKIKEFNPDWLPPHPLNILIDMIDYDKYRYNNYWEKRNQSVTK